MHHIVTLDRLARYRVEERLHEAEHAAHLRLAREARAAGRPTGGAGRLSRLVRMVVALAVGER